MRGVKWREGLTNGGKVAAYVLSCVTGVEMIDAGKVGGGVFAKASEVFLFSGTTDWYLCV